MYEREREEVILESKCVIFDDDNDYDCYSRSLGLS